MKLPAASNPLLLCSIFTRTLEPYRITLTQLEMIQKKQGCPNTEYFRSGQPLKKHRQSNWVFFSSTRLFS